MKCKEDRIWRTKTIKDLWRLWNSVGKLGKGLWYGTGVCRDCNVGGKALDEAPWLE